MIVHLHTGPKKEKKSFSSLLEVCTFHTKTCFALSHVSQCLPKCIANTDLHRKNASGIHGQKQCVWE